MRGADTDPSGPYFFLSYARTPSWGPDGGDPDHWVNVLFRDLCNHIMALTDLPAGSSVGFMDRELRSGESWSDKLSENLATCRVFVPLYSPRYFANEMCGREWFAFNERTVRAKAVGASEQLAIVPALWTRVDLDQLPHSVRHLHVDLSSFGQRYQSHGLYGLIKLNRLRDEYEEAVFALSSRIVRVAEESRLPASVPPVYDQLPSAFDRQRELQPLNIVVAAARRDELPAKRGGGAYGERELDWNPYHPLSTRPLALLAEELSRLLGLRVGLHSLDQVTDRSGGLRPPVGPTLLLVDPWALLHPGLSARLSRFDAKAAPWTRVVIPWNREDPDNLAPGAPDPSQLENVIPQMLQLTRATSRASVAGVGSQELFSELLSLVVRHVYAEFARQVPVPAFPPQVRPRLVGPSASSEVPGDREP
ncbi:FxsC-like protein [Streptomyces sp. SAI-208]|uniref:TIR-like protein FxsC n=1 Tax=Streptomyces sp. SAI-208 TaxID=2940550 RepID=UPI002473E2F0|nr:TIR-like protein FxsC [Streptomyces sp. SAI-208]MDH6610951.1 FxsC-like protein [Streptomyces sp. SAI-208]